jgi:hypothetical protein
MAQIDQVRKAAPDAVSKVQNVAPIALPFSVLPVIGVLAVLALFMIKAK